MFDQSLGSLRLYTRATFSLFPSPFIESDSSAKLISFLFSLQGSSREQRVGDIQDGFRGHGDAARSVSIHISDRVRIVIESRMNVAH